MTAASHEVIERLREMGVDGVTAVRLVGAPMTAPGRIAAERFGFADSFYAAPVGETYGLTAAQVREVVEDRRYGAGSSLMRKFGIERWQLRALRAAYGTPGR